MTTATRSKHACIPLENGAHLSAQEFMERYEASEPSLKAELIDGVVFVASPVSIDHSEAHARLVFWLGAYTALRGGVAVGDNGTVRLGGENVPQPDAYLRLLESDQNRVEGNYLDGAPELVAEIAASSASIDLHEKLEVYRRHGVREYIVWRVYDDAIDWFALERDAYVPLKPNRRGVIESRLFPGLRLHVKALLKGDMAAVLAELQRP